MLDYCNNDTSKHVATEYMDAANDLTYALTNPVQEFFYWIKGEIYDLQALNDCFMARERMMKQIQKIEGKIKSDKADIDKISQGRFLDFFSIILQILIVGL